MDSIDILEAAKIIGIPNLSPQDISKNLFALQNTKICKICKSLEVNCATPQIHQLFTVTYDSVAQPPAASVDAQAAHVLDLNNL